MARPLRLFALLHRARAAIFGRANAESVSELGISLPQLLVLFALPKEGSRRPSELALELDVDAAAVTRLVERLSTVGFVARVPDPEDGRSRRVAITPAGAALRARGSSALARANGAIAAPFTPEELATVARFLEHVIAYGRGGEP